ncbi:MAG TPA: TetR/AcrR family transcriptional regulator [Mycobacteriales bacterium]|nr:TetR/AcrR family transcriptional regulator [Mycobacteriales bacterium]
MDVRLTAELRRRDEILDTASALFASRGLRISLEEIAGACGIKPGSLYHHFDSKEAIVIELIQRYHAALDHLAEVSMDHDGARTTGDPIDRVIALATAIAACASRHSAAVQFTFYDPPGGASQELVRVAGRAPTAIQTAMFETLRTGQEAGSIRPGLDLAIVSDRFCQTMLHVGLGLFHSLAPDQVARTLSAILLHGLAAGQPRSADLDRSAALAAVKQVIKTWPVPEEDPPTDRASMIYAAARAELGRRGYEVTTIRDIAAAVGLGTGSVYRVIGSKEALLASIMRDFSEKAVAGWTAALSSDATAVEKLDAVCWLQINVMERFYDEFKIQLAWLRQVPPDIPDLGWSFPALLRRLKSQLADGVRAGELTIERPTSELAARCVVEVTWIPENIVRDIGDRAAFLHARDTVLRGIATR